MNSSKQYTWVEKDNPPYTLIRDNNQICLQIKGNEGISLDQARGYLEESGLNQALWSNYIVVPGPLHGIQFILKNTIESDTTDDFIETIRPAVHQQIEEGTSHFKSARYIYQNGGIEGNAIAIRIKNNSAIDYIEELFKERQWTIEALPLVDNFILLMVDDKEDSVARAASLNDPIHTQFIEFAYPDMEYAIQRCN